ncbi:MAG: cytidine deaminase [Eubacteriales bacterium]|nr:cytidine deaminase [Eubacteriales bacterium]
MINAIVPKELINQAKAAMQNAYVPYSHFKVGAALLTKSGKVYTGCNIENASYTPTNCAERTAFFKAVSESENEFEAIAVVGGLNGEIKDYCSPCGVCRQVMSEFCRDDFKIYIGRDDDEYLVYTLAELLPLRFSGKDIK